MAAAVGCDGRADHCPGEYLPGQRAGPGFETRRLDLAVGIYGRAYGLLSLLQNKDPRHIMPYLPVVLLALVRATLVGQRRSDICAPLQQ
jgi:hypothetical protein